MRTLPETLNVEEIESSLTFIGFAGMIDPPRSEAKEAVSACIQAGIIPVMITGTKLTAKAIAKQLGIITSGGRRYIEWNQNGSIIKKSFQIVEHVAFMLNPEQKLKL
jgi:Ca2+-transporting ATPase